MENGMMGGGQGSEPPMRRFLGNRGLSDFITNVLVSLSLSLLIGQWHSKLYMLRLESILEILEEN